MSTNQLHGKTFEGEVIRKCFGVPEEQLESFKSTAVFDIPFGVVTCQHPTGEPVSIKTAAVKAATVCLSDARRVWSWDRPLILVVGLYAQVGGAKVFHTVYEFHFCLNEKERLMLYGTLSFDEVSLFHETLKTFGVGNHAAASVWAKKQKKLLGPRCGAIKLNAKIDSKTQRRLQCSARLIGLVEACEKTICFTVPEKGTAEYRGLPLPYVVVSSSREFS